MSTDAEAHVLFDLAGTTYAIPARDVQRLEMVEQITPIPNAPPFVDGVVFSRGQVVPAVNLRTRFGFARVPHDAKTRLIVDSARDFLAVPAAAVHPPPEALAHTNGRYLRGIARVGERMILILDVAEVVAPSAATGKS